MTSGATPAELRLRLIRDSRRAGRPIRSARPSSSGCRTPSSSWSPASGTPTGGSRGTSPLTAKPGKDAARPNFTGRFASGPADDRFVYLAWRSLPRGVWINRIKARLAGIDWAMIEKARAENRRLVADMSGWTPHDGRRQVEWRLQ